MTKKTIIAASAAALMLLSSVAQAADWSDTSISYRYGTRFAEPFNGTDISKHIFALTHVSGYKYGSNFVNVDLLQSDSNDPGSLNQTSGAQEAYVVYRHTLDSSIRAAALAAIIVFLVIECVVQLCLHVPPDWRPPGGQPAVRLRAPGRHRAGR